MPDLNERIALAAERLGVVAAERRHVVVTAESCTGGGIAAAITAVSYTHLTLPTICSV